MGDHELTSDAAYQNLLARISDDYATGQYPKGQKPSDLLSSSHHVELAMPDSYDSLLIQMKECAASLQELQRQAAQSCALVVNDLIGTKSQDAQAIEHTLDRLLDCTCHPDGLVLFKSLCRYYFTLNPAATADYVRYYREMWDSESDQEQVAAP